MLLCYQIAKIIIRNNKGTEKEQKQKIILPLSGVWSQKKQKNEKKEEKV